MVISLSKGEFKAIGQGFSGGLKAMAEGYGLMVG